MGWDQPISGFLRKLRFLRKVPRETAHFWCPAPRPRLAPARTEVASESSLVNKISRLVPALEVRSGCGMGSFAETGSNGEVVPVADPAAMPTLSRSRLPQSDSIARFLVV
jgi:hypothetical protein